MNRPASMSVSTNPLVPPRAPLRIPAGIRALDLKPATSLPLMLRVNGEWLLRADWELVVEEGDVVEWHCVPQGNRNSRGILQVLLLVVAVAYGAYTGDWATAAKIYAIGSAVLTIFNILVPIRQPSRSATTSPGSVYNVQLAGNQARLNEPIPVIYGRMRTYPDFAAQAYGEYANNDQVFCALYCIGQGHYTVESLAIANSPFASFADLQYAILPPGTAPGLVLANVYNAPEAAGQDIKTGVVVGGFAACRSGKTVTAVGLDIVFAQGLVTINNSGVQSNASVTLRFDAQQIDDFDVAVGDWYALNTEVITRATTTPVRISFKYPLAAAARVQVRMTRLDAYVDSLQVQNSPTLGGLRGYVAVSATLSPTATHLELRVRASAQLSQFSQGRVNCIVRRKLRSWSPAGGGTWAAEAETRSIAWALADVWTNPDYGDALADARVDLQTLYELDQVWTARQDRCDLLLDSKVTSWDAATTIAQIGRGRPFRRAGVNTLFRDQLVTLPVTAFTSRNILSGLDLGYSLATEITADGVIVEYFSNRTWQFESVTCPAPGVVTPTNAPRVRLMGITGAKHAEREGLYQAAQNLYRRKFPKWQTELVGMLPPLGAMVLYAPDLPGYGQAGDVTDWNDGTLTMTLSEPAVFTPGASGHYVSVLRDDGTVTPAIAATPGPTENLIVLASAPLLADDVTPMTFVVDDAARERPKYIFGAAGQHRVPVRVLGVRKAAKGQAGEQLIEMSGVNEDDRIHAVDNALLPSPGEIQDPVDSRTIPISGGGSGGLTVPVVTFGDHLVVSSTTNTGLGLTASFTLANDGTASGATTGDFGVIDSFAGQWLNAPVAPAVAGLYEVRVTLAGITGVIIPFDGLTEGGPVLAGGVTVGSAAVGAWLALDTSRTWTIDHTLATVDGYHVGQRFIVEIRAVGTAIVLATRNVDLVIATNVYTP